MHLSEFITEVFTFNKNLIALLGILEKSSPGNGDVYMLKNRIKLAKDENRELLIERCGPFLLKYAAEIRAKNVEFFLNMQNIEEIAKLDPASPEREIVHNLFGEISNCYRKMKPEKFDEVYAKIVEMLGAYEARK